MGRPLRFLPENKHGSLVEITCRVIGARGMLVPKPNQRLFNQVVVGVMGRALEVSPVELCGAVWTSNHYHLLLVAREQQEISRFMAHLNCNMSKEIGTRIREWRGAFWERRFDQVPVSDEPEKQWERLKYLLSHGVKEQLVETPTKWPGVHCAEALMNGAKLEGFWWNRSKAWTAEQRGEKGVGAYDYATRYLVGFAPLPAFRDLSSEEYQEKVRELVREIEEEGAAALGDNTVAGVEKILAQNPKKVPTVRPKREPRPHFHAKARETRKALRAEQRAFEAQFRIAAEGLLGERGRRATEEFPYGCYPPALPFIGSPAPPRPPAPPTRRLVLEKGKVVELGEIPTVEPPVRLWRVITSATGSDPVVKSRARGQPP